MLSVLSCRGTHVVAISACSNTVLTQDAVMNPSRAGACVVAVVTTSSGAKHVVLLSPRAH